MDFKQTSWTGGINLLLDDTRLPVSSSYKEGDSPFDLTFNQYRLGLNVRTRFDVCSPIPSSVVDLQAPAGVKQAIVTFGNYIILFSAGLAWYKLNTQTGWTQIANFSMSTTAPRYWTVAIPLATTNYGRLAGTNTDGLVSANLPITQVNQINTVAGTFSNVPGLLVQDGITQPQFIFIDSNGQVQCRTTQTFAEWTFPLNLTTLEIEGPDDREYVPIGTYMEWFNGILFIVDPNYNYIYRSVSGRPLDFVINVDEEGQKGGDATTTSYSVGVNGITAMKSLSGNMLFVAAGGAACFSVTLNTTPNAPQIFNEYTFIRTPLFNANCITERGIVDILGDSVFIDSNGLRSFNAVEQQQNEGRNSIFSSTVQSLFSGIFQSAMTNTSSQPGWCAAEVFDNYAIFSVNTVFGYVLLVYDTISNCYASLDVDQLGDHAAKQFAAIIVNSLALYCITDDDRVVQLYGAPSAFDTTTVRLGAISSQKPMKELKVQQVRSILTNITKDTSITCTLFTNNRLDSGLITRLKYSIPSKYYVGVPIGLDVGTQTNNILMSFPNSNSGWKSFIVLSWTGGASLTSVSINTSDETPMQPTQTQAVIKQT